MRVVGIDPGSYITGYGVIEKRGSVLVHVDNGVIRPNNSLPFSQRLFNIHEDIIKLIKEYKPQALALEDIFMAKNAKTCIKLGHIRGAAMLAAMSSSLDLAEYHPVQVKQAVAGVGQASKDQVQKMVKALLKLPEVATEDASDALAVAICHLHTDGMKKKMLEHLPQRHKDTKKTKNILIGGHKL